MEIRLDGSEIRIQVNSIDDCNNILDNNDILRIFINKLSAEDYAVSERLFDGAYGEQSAFDNAPIDEPDSDDEF
jgi:hypothetical protein